MSEQGQQITKAGNGSTSTALARQGSGFSGSIHLRSMEDVVHTAEYLAHPEAAGMIPKHFVNRPHALAAVILSGIELGMGAMEAIRSLHMIEGRPTMSAETMHARARRFGHKTKWIEMSATRAAIEVDGTLVSFTIEEAKAAGLTGKDNWKKYTAAMLRARCVSAAIRAVCPEVMGSGIYTPEEIDPDLAVDETGEVTIEAIAAKVSDTTRGPAARLSDARSPDDVLAWCTSNRSRLTGARNGARERGIVEIRQHAQRVGLDPERALSTAGLASAPASAPAQESSGSAPGTLRFKMGHHEKGAPITELSDEGITSYRTAIAKSLSDPEKARFRADNETHLGEIDREIAKRRGEDAEHDADERLAGDPDAY